MNDARAALDKPEFPTPEIAADPQATTCQGQLSPPWERP